MDRLLLYGVNAVKTIMSYLGYTAKREGNVGYFQQIFAVPRNAEMDHLLLHGSTL